MFQKGKEREETRVDSWWMFFHGHLQTGCCSSAVLSHLFVCSTPPGHPEGLPGILLLLSTPEWAGVTGNPSE